MNLIKQIEIKLTLMMMIQYIQMINVHLMIINHLDQEKVQVQMMDIMV
jgi:hypothetical protein